MKKDWVATPEALESLVTWLDGDARAPEGASYVAMHGRLAAYFTRKGCRAPEELADETLTRVARRLQEEGTITGVPAAQYCYIVARFVWLEHLRSPDYTARPVVRDISSAPVRTEDESDRERSLACLDQCLHRLDPPDRDVILGYYSGAGADRIRLRRELAERLRLTANAVAIRASRTRERLRGCVADCTADR